MRVVKAQASIGLFIALMSCRTTGPILHVSQSPASTPLAQVGRNSESGHETFAAFARSMIDLSLHRLYTDLDALNRQPSSGTIHSAFASLTETHDLFAIFVHCFPKGPRGDEWAETSATLAYGRSLLEELDGKHADRLLKARNSADIRPDGMTWSRAFLQDPRRNALRDILGRMNRDYATKRERHDDADFFWSQVDFIPDLRAPAMEGLEGFMRAMIKGIRVDAESLPERFEAGSRESHKGILRMHGRLRLLSKLTRYFPEAATADAPLKAMLQQLEDLGRGYENFVAKIHLQENLGTEGQTAHAKDLSQGLSVEWRELLAQQNRSLTLDKRLAPTH